MSSSCGKHVLLACILCIIMTTHHTASAQQRLTIGISQYPSTLHPSIDSLLTNQYVLGMLRRPFMVYDAEWKLVCLLCRDIPSHEAQTIQNETLDDGTPSIAVTYTITDEAQWGDGTPITTKDVLFTWEAGKHPDSGFADSELYTRHIVDITILDEHTFTLHLFKQLCKPEGLIANFYILPEHLERPVFEASPQDYKYRTLYQTDPTNRGLYFGPYRVTEIRPGAAIVVETNPNWWGKQPYFSSIILRAIENSSALESALLAGDIDYIPGEIGLHFDQALVLHERLEQDPRFDFEYKSGLIYEHLDLNHDHPILADIRVRQALLLGLDRQTISQALFNGRQEVAHNAVNPLDTNHYPGYRQYSFDVTEANRLLDQAGWTQRRNGIRTNQAGQRLQFMITTTTGNRSRERVQQILQSMWRDIGVEVRIQNYIPRILFGEILPQRRFEIAMYAWISGPETIPRTTLHSTLIPSETNDYTGQNFVGFRDAELDSILDALEVACEAKISRALWTRLQEIYAERLPALPLFYRTDVYIKPFWLKGIVPTGHEFSSTLWIEDWYRE